MRLNYDAIRDVLIYIADNFGYINSNDDFPNQHEILTPYLIIEGVLTNSDKPYTRDDISYAIEQLLREGYFRTAIPIQYEKNNDMGYAPITDITMKGHSLLSSLENEKVWNAVKELSIKRGRMPLNVLVKVCGQLSMLAMAQPDALLNIEKAITTCFGALL